MFWNAKNKLFWFFFFRHFFHNFAVPSFITSVLRTIIFHKKQQHVKSQYFASNEKKNISRLSFRRQIFIAHAYVCIHYLVCIALFVLSMEFHYNFFCFFRFSTSIFDINWSCFKCFSVDASHSFFSISHNSFYILIMVSPFFNTF